MMRVPESVRKVRIQTGNILNLTEIIKKAGQKPTEELLECLKIVLNKGRAETLNDTLIVSPEGDLFSGDYGPKDLTISVKLFITDDTGEGLREALDKLYEHVHLSILDSVVLSYRGSSKIEEVIPRLWSILEGYVREGKILRIGLSDIDTDLFINIYNSVEIKPSIIQINLAHCCVVPPALQEFAKAHDIQLLTHNDPSELVTNLNGIFDPSADKLKMYWASRFQIHIKCRGVLATKGYVIEFVC